MEGESSSEEDEPVKIPTPAPPQPPMPPPPPPPSEIPPLPPTPDQVIIKKDYNPKGLLTVVTQISITKNILVCFK